MKFVSTTKELNIVTNQDTVPRMVNDPIPLKEVSFIKSLFSQLTISHIIIMWFSGVILFGISVLLWIMHVNNLLKKCNPVEKSDINELLKRRCNDLKITKTIRMYYLDINMPVGPTVTGVFHPKILLPHRIADKWSMKDIEPVLLHELIHVKRHDLLINWFQIIIQILFFFHPLVWYANRKIREKREEVCDDITIRLIEQKRKRYSMSILNVLEGILYEPILGLADIGFSERKSSLAKRIIRITNKNYEYFKPLSLPSFIALLLISVFSISLACDRSVGSITGNLSINETNLQTPVIVKDPENAETEDYIILEIIDDGIYKIDGLSSNKSDLSIVLKDVLQKSQKNKLSIRAKVKYSTEEINEIMITAYKLGIKQIATIKYDN